MFYETIITFKKTTELLEQLLYCSFNSWSEMYWDKTPKHLLEGFETFFEGRDFTTQVRITDNTIIIYIILVENDHYKYQDAIKHLFEAFDGISIEVQEMEEDEDGIVSSID